MEKVRCYVAVLVGLGIFTIGSSAQALTFNVSDINFTDLIGDKEDFRWSVGSVSVEQFTLEVGQQHTFTYGQFYTAAFHINPPAGGDNDDVFRANFKVDSSNHSAFYESLATPDATYVRSQLGSAIVDIDNTLIDHYFDITGYYTIEFLDVPEFSGDGYRNLQATLTYLNAPMTNGGSERGPAPIPEPSTFILLGAGLAGLVALRKKRP